jgi:hypothetical protein
MPNVTYNGALEALAKAQANLATADIRMILLQASYTPDKDHRFVSALAASEVSVAGYARMPLANKTVVRDDANDFAYMDADDVVWPTLAAGQTIGGAAIYLHTGADATNLMIGFYDLPDTPTRDYIAVQFAAPAAGAAVKLYQP